MSTLVRYNKGDFFPFERYTIFSCYVLIPDMLILRLVTSVLITSAVKMKSSKSFEPVQSHLFFLQRWSDASLRKRKFGYRFFIFSIHSKWESHSRKVCPLNKYLCSICAIKKFGFATKVLHTLSIFTFLVLTTTTIGILYNFLGRRFIS